MEKSISFVIPIFNEQNSLRELYDQLKQITKNKLREFTPEIIFINDGSTDNSLKVLKQLHDQDSNVKIISFRRNLGKATALNQGFKKASGDIVVTMDGDLQDGPENIPALIEKLNKGYDLVIGWKEQRHDPLTKLIPSRAFNFFVRIFSKIPLHDFNSGLKVMKSEVAKEVYLYGELHRFIPVLAFQQGFKLSEIPVIHHPRKYGTTKYGWERLLKGFFDFLTVMFLSSFGQRPLHLFGLIGAFGMILGIIFGIYLSVLHFQGISIGTRPLLTLSVLLVVAGLQMLSIGLIAEMIVNKSKSEEKKLPIDYETK